jgi:hypothetical protein
MLKQRKFRIRVVAILILSVFLLVLFNNTQNSLGNNSNKFTEVKNLSFQIFEFSDDKGQMENISSIYIESPSSNWNVTSINLNFSNILYYEREIKNHRKRN